MYFDERKLKDAFSDGYDSEEQHLERTNVLVCGNTGAGKSSFINTLMGKEVAKVGTGSPVTRGIHKYDAGKNLFIYDSEGYEVDNFKEFTSAVLNKMEDGSKSDDFIHLALFCISVPGARVTDFDINLIKYIADEKSVPTAVILTQIDNASEEDSQNMQKEIHKSFPKIEVFEFTTDKKLMKELDLVNQINKWIYATLPEGQQQAFLKSSLTAIKERYEKSKKCVLQHAASGGIIGFNPIPFSDTPILIANQMVLLGRIANIWEVSLPASVTSSSLVSSLLSQLGKSVAGNLLKLIPGIGSIAGGVINAGVASAVTYGFGTATNMVFKKYAQAKLNGENFPLEDLFLSDAFSEQIKQAFNTYNK